MFVDADVGRVGWRTIERRRIADREFLAKLRAASLDELHVIAKNHAHKKTPKWKRIAIERAIARATPR